jgi:NADP-dependent 3-hydroxy acid dehydrogenase YdfG
MAKTAVVTGASSGIGAAAVGALRAEGLDVVGVARRPDRLREVCEAAGATWQILDVTDRSAVDAFAASLASCDVLVNNAGGAHGLEPLTEADDDHWRVMWEVNVMGLMYATRALLPHLIASGDGHVVNIGSIAGFETYDGGAGYTAAKHAVRAITDTLRLELLGRPVRVTEIDPGMVETEFSVVRLGSEDAAAKVYAGLTPLTAADVADCIAFAVTRPSHVDIDLMVVRPRDQARAQRVHRRSPT